MNKTIEVLCVFFEADETLEAAGLPDEEEEKFDLSTIIISTIECFYPFENPKYTKVSFKSGGGSIILKMPYAEFKDLYHKVSEFIQEKPVS